MAEVEIPVTTDLKLIYSGSGTLISNLNGIQNGIVLEYSDGSKYVTQRPSMDGLYTPADQSVLDTEGRGIYYWEYAGALYFVNNAVLYKTNYAGPITTTASLSTGTQRVWWAEMQNYLVIIDPENNEGFYLDADVDDTDLQSISDLSFPPNQTPALSLASGVVVLDDTCYVLDTTGAIWGSDLSDPTAWSGTNVITAEVSDDAGVAITKHHDNLAVFGTRSLQFFYDAAVEAPASPLAPRSDISYNIGCASGNSLWTSDDVTYFLGLSETGQIAAYKLQNFELQEISKPTITAVLSNYYSTTNTLVGSGFRYENSDYYVITVLNASQVPQVSIVYNSLSGIWTTWEHATTAIVAFPLMGWTRIPGASFNGGAGIFNTGDVQQVNSAVTPVDSIGVTLANISMVIQIPNLDFETRENKFMSKLRYVGDQTPSSQNLAVQWSDEVISTYNTARNIDTGDLNNKLTRLGKFKVRNFKLTYAGDEQVRIQKLMAEIRKGTT